MENQEKNKQIYEMLNPFGVNWEYLESKPDYKNIYNLWEAWKFVIKVFVSEEERKDNNFLMCLNAVSLGDEKLLFEAIVATAIHINSLPKPFNLSRRIQRTFHGAKWYYQFTGKSAATHELLEKATMNLQTGLVPIRFINEAFDHPCMEETEKAIKSNDPTAEQRVVLYASAMANVIAWRVIADLDIPIEEGNIVFYFDDI